ncbi:unnamed protein product, partial [Prorocentrum cordatum]
APRALPRTPAPHSSSAMVVASRPARLRSQLVQGRQLCGVPRRLRGGGLHRRAAVQTLLPPRLHREVARGVPPDLPAVLRGLRRRRRQLRRQRASRVFAAVTRRRRRRCRSPGPQRVRRRLGQLLGEPS